MSKFLVRHTISLAPLTTFGIGGKAKEYINVTDANQFLEVLQWVYKEKKKFVVFAGGSNVVFPDEGCEGVVIHVLGGNIKSIVNKDIIKGHSRESGNPLLNVWIPDLVGDDNKSNKKFYFLVDGGVLLKDVIDKSIDSGLPGLESLSGIPGTIGGAVVGNAGAYGRSIADAVEKVFVFDGVKTFWLEKKSCQFAYRDSIFKHKSLFLLQARLRFQKGNKEELLKTSKEIIALRRKKYKPGIKCPGSFFKNILVSDLSSDQLVNIDPKWIKYGKIPAGYLLEHVGAKGMKIGGIEVADYHGNLLLNNTGKGTAKEVKQLAYLLKKKVKERFGVELEEEVRYIEIK